MVEIDSVTLKNIVILYLVGNVMYKGRYIGITEIEGEKGILLMISDKSRVHIWVPLSSISKIHDIGQR